MNPSALVFVITGLNVILFAFLWRTISAWLVARDPESAVGGAMSALI